jgi:hypothetical protein
VTRDPEAAARRALRWYPKNWRTRYGEEFSELLASELAERPRSWRRGLDVAWHGVVARLTDAGLTAHPREPSVQVRAGLATFGGALAVFLVFGEAMWSQLTIGWQWARPDTVGTTEALVLMFAAVLFFAMLALLAAVPIACTVVDHVARRKSRGLVRPALLFLLGTAVLVAGSRHFANGWPGTGGHAWAYRGLVPGGMAAFTWASTLSITSYWAHPGALLSFPPAEVAWMMISPLAITGLVAGAVTTVRRVELSSRLLRYEERIGRVAAFTMVVFLAGAAAWIVDGGPGPRNLFHAGTIDVVGLCSMIAASAVALRALGRTRPSARLLAR